MSPSTLQINKNTRSTSRNKYIIDQNTTSTSQIITQQAHAKVAVGQQHQAVVAEVPVADYDSVGVNVGLEEVTSAAPHVAEVEWLDVSPPPCRPYLAGPHLHAGQIRWPPTSTPAISSGPHHQASESDGGHWGEVEGRAEGGAVVVAPSIAAPPVRRRGPPLERERGRLRWRWQGGWRRGGGGQKGKGKSWGKEADERRRRAMKWWERRQWSGMGGGKIAREEKRGREERRFDERGGSGWVRVWITMRASRLLGLFRVLYVSIFFEKKYL